MLLARGALQLKEAFERDEPEDFRNLPGLRNRSDEDIEFIRFGFIESLTNIARQNFDIAARGSALQAIEAVNRTAAEGLAIRALPRTARRIVRVLKRIVGIPHGQVQKAAQFSCNPGTATCSGEIVTRVVK